MHRPPGIVSRFLSGKKQLFVLVDPENEDDPDLLDWKIRAMSRADVDGIFLGGSTLTRDFSKSVFNATKRYGVGPVIGFPGSAGQVYPELDALLFTSLVSGNHPRFLIEEQRKAAPAIYRLELPTIACGYLLIDPDGRSTTSKVSEHPGPVSLDYVLSSALAAKYMGMQCIYLEGGSGTERPIPASWISSVKEITGLPLILGGGIGTPDAIVGAWNAGADTVVIGTVVEQNPAFLHTLQSLHTEYAVENKPDIHPHPDSR